MVTRSDTVGAAAIVLGAGLGRRLGASEPKAFLTIGGRPILGVAAGSAAAARSVSLLIVTCPAGSEDRARGTLEALSVPVVVIPGGPTRQDSVRAALAALPDGIELVAVHDAARPFASPELFDQVLGSVSAAGPEPAQGVIPVVPIPDTVKRIHDGVVLGTEPREELAVAQTPQAFHLPALLDAHARAQETGLGLTDDAQALEAAGYVVRGIAGDPMNFKITTLLDLARADSRMSRADA